MTTRACAPLALLRAGFLAGAVSALAACGGATGEEAAAPDAGPLRERPAAEGRLFGDELTLNTLGQQGGVLGGEETGDALPVNRYLWQASLDTLSFLPLESTDPFTGVIATEWATTPDDPNERIKVSVFHTRPVLEASSLRVAVYRQARNADGVWVAQSVSPDTVRRLENAILTRARQIRIAGREDDSEAADAG